MVRDGAARHEVLITRPAGEAEGTAALVRGMGLVPVVAPLFRVEALALRMPVGCEAMLMTSGNALEGLPVLGLPVLAVGDVTAARARAAGFADVVSAGGDAADLLALARASLPAGARVLLATGRGQGFVLRDGLRAAGFRVHRRVVYAMRPVPRLPEVAVAALGGGRLRAALFLSAETARCFTRVLPGVLYPALDGIEALAIGQPAADALALLPWGRVRVSLAPTLEHVLALL